MLKKKPQKLKVAVEKNSKHTKGGEGGVGQHTL